MLKKKNIIISLSILSLFLPTITQAQTYYGNGNTVKQNPNVYYGGNQNQKSFGGGYKEQYNFNKNQQPTIKSQMTQKNPTQTQTASLSQSNSIFYEKGVKPCWDQAAEYHRVDPWLLYSIAFVESGFNPNATNTNKNGSTDIGMMQINTIWLPQLKKMGISREMLKDACTSTYVGAWILSQNIKRFGYTWRAIGAYNSATPKIGYKYAKKVYAAHNKFTGQTAQGWR